MSPPARASVAFGAYASAMGILLAVAPNPTIALFSLPATDEPWIRVVAGMALALGLYYIEAGRQELVPFFRASVLGRGAFALVVGATAVAYGQWPLLIFAAVDGISAGVTAGLLARR